MQPDLLAELARDIDGTCRLTGSFTLRSGQTATEYFDKYLFESDPQLRRRVAEAMRPLVPDDTELLGGLELGGIPPGHHDQQHHRHTSAVRPQKGPSSTAPDAWPKGPT